MLKIDTASRYWENLGKKNPTRTIKQRLHLWDSSLGKKHHVCPVSVLLLRALLLITIPVSPHKNVRALLHRPLLESDTVKQTFGFT